MWVLHRPLVVIWLLWIDKGISKENLRTALFLLYILYIEQWEFRCIKFQTITKSSLHLDVLDRHVRCSSVDNSTTSSTHWRQWISVICLALYSSMTWLHKCALNNIYLTLTTPPVYTLSSCPIYLCGYIPIYIRWSSNIFFGGGQTKAARYLSWLLVTMNRRPASFLTVRITLDLIGGCVPLSWHDVHKNEE